MRNERESCKNKNDNLLDYIFEKFLVIIGDHHWSSIGTGNDKDDDGNE